MLRMFHNGVADTGRSKMATPRYVDELLEVAVPVTTPGVAEVAVNIRLDGGPVVVFTDVPDMELNVALKACMKPNTTKSLASGVVTDIDNEGPVPEMPILVMSTDRAPENSASIPCILAVQVPWQTIDVTPDPRIA